MNCGQVLWTVTLPLLAAPSTPADEPAGPIYLADALEDHVVSVIQGWGVLGINTAVKPAQGDAMQLRIKDTTYARGLGHHANGEIVIDLDGRFQAFQADVGVQWQRGQNVASVVLQVYVDDDKVFDSGVMGEQDPPRVIDIPCRSASLLRLVATDAGDGITCDCANWADARLIPDPDAVARPLADRLEITPFGRVVTFDPQRSTGTSAGRVAEFPAEDVLLHRELAPRADGAYVVPTDAAGSGCIGLYWVEQRLPRLLTLTFAEPDLAPPPEQVKLQAWTGESEWQGEWQELAGVAATEAGHWSYRVGYRDLPRGTQKLRWLFPPTAQPLVIKELHAWSQTVCKTVALRIEAESPATGDAVQVGIYNGRILIGAADDSVLARAWNPTAPLELAVSYARPSPITVDRTVLRFEHRGAAVGVAVDDVVAHGAVYVPSAGLYVTRDPAPLSLAEYKRQIAGRQTMLDEVRRLPDQSFPQAMAAVHNPVQDHGPMLVSLACDNRKFTVHRNGTIDFRITDQPDANYPAILYSVNRSPDSLACAQLRPTFGDGNLDHVARHLDGGWLPLVVTAVDQEGLVYRQRSFVAPVDDEPPAGAPDWLRYRAVCVAEYTIENTRPQAAAAEFSLALFENAAENQRIDWATTADHTLAMHGDRLVASVEDAGSGPLSATIQQGAFHLAGELPAGGQARIRVFLPAWTATRVEAATFDGETDWAARTADYWRERLASAMQVELPDPLLTNVIRASQVHCLLAARNEANGARIAPWIGSDRYGPLESEAQAVIRGMDMLGQAEFARRGLEFFIHRYNEAGFLTTGYTIVGTGEHLWTLAEHVDRSQGRDWLKPIAPEVARVCRWVMAQRAKTRLTDAAGQPLPQSGLMAPGVSADWRRYAYRLFNDAQYCAGLREAGRLLEEVGEPGADAIRADAAAYREDLLRAYRWSRGRSPAVALNNGAWVPYYPAILFCFGPIEGFLPGEDGNRSWCYNIELGAHHLAATAILDPRSEEVGWICDHMEDVQFLRTGMGDYPEASNRADPFGRGGFSKVQPYYSRHAEVLALRDDVKPFIRAYFNAIPSLLNTENLSFWEHFHNLGGWNKTHETGWFLCQTRTMLLQERGEQLWLAPFVTTNWLEQGMAVTVREAPTRFGKVSYGITSAADDGQLAAWIDPPAEAPPGGVVVRLRHPSGQRLQSVEINGQPHREFDPEQSTVTVRPANGRVEIRAKYAP